MPDLHKLRSHSYISLLQLLVFLIIATTDQVCYYYCSYYSSEQYLQIPAWW